MDTGFLGAPHSWSSVSMQWWYASPLIAFCCCRAASSRLLSSLSLRAGEQPQLVCLQGWLSSQVCESCYAVLLIAFWCCRAADSRLLQPACR